ncbi:hypothetical protein NM208_g10610 [Fusarium decemcellulare]|uniref:Uncharacterized protein n=1 Tax=Fusarium decemcellulare TaxID=57161 RepID=A0ACC1RX88_9HYPO|nr:hypothetical protein NM208_g10610 [Fusarium decemcellulare]
MSNPQDPNWVGYWAPTNSSRAPPPSARRAANVYARHASCYQIQNDTSLPASCGDQSEDLLEQELRNVGEDTLIKQDPVNEHKDSPEGSREKNRDTNLADEPAMDPEMMDQDLPEEQDELHDEVLEHVSPALLGNESCSGGCQKHRAALEERIKILESITEKHVDDMDYILPWMTEMMSANQETKNEVWKMKRDFTSRFQRIERWKVTASRWIFGDHDSNPQPSLEEMCKTAERFNRMHSKKST